jgi:hypothetical protein
MFVYIKENEMKKVALSLLAFALVGAMAFGQDAAPVMKLGGYLDMGTLTTVKADTGSATIVKGDDSGIVGGSYEFRATYGTAKSGLVLNVRFQDLSAPLGLATVTPATGSTLAVGTTGTVYNAQDAFMWFLLPGVDMVKFAAGQYGNTGTAWNQLDDKGDKQGNGLGAKVEVTPVEGFTAGLSVLPNGAKNAIYGVGATYTVPATVQVVGGLATGLNKDSAIAASNFAASFKLLLDGPLSVKGGVNLYKLESDKQVGTQITDFTVGYAITDAFSAGLLTYVYTYGSDLKAADDSLGAIPVSYKINPYVNYTVDPVTAVGFGVTYQSGASLGGTLSAAQVTAIQTAAATAGATLAQVTALGTSYTGTYVTKISQFEINPNATFTIDANSKIYVNYLYDMLSGDSKPAKDQTFSTIKVDYRFTF